MPISYLASKAALPSGLAATGEVAEAVDAIEAVETLLGVLFVLLDVDDAADSSFFLPPKIDLSLSISNDGVFGFGLVWRRVTTVGDWVSSSRNSGQNFSNVDKGSGHATFHLTHAPRTFLSLRYF